MIEEETLDETQKTKHRSFLKASSSILCSYFKKYLSFTENKNSAKIRTRKKLPSSKNKSVLPKTIYDSFRLPFCIRFLEALSTIFTYKIQHLWSPPIIEEEFLRLIVDFCFKLLEDSSICKIKNFLSSTITLLGLLCSRHNCMLDITLKTLAIAQIIEGQSQCMANLVSSIVTDYGCTGFITQLFRELADSNKNDMFTDSVCSRNSAHFLSCIGRSIPKEVLNNASLLMCHLEWDAYSMRNAVLSCFGQIIVQVYSNDLLDDVTKKSRDSFLGKLTDHIHDVNAYVRSHVLQVWNEIVTLHLVPIVRFNSLASLVIGRLQDKSCNVRKNSSCLLYQLLANNPFATSLNPSIIEKQLLDAKASYKEVPDPSIEVIERASKQWEVIEQGLKEFLICDTDNNLNSNLSPDLLQDNLRSEVISLFLSSNFSAALKVLETALDLKKEPSSSVISFCKVLYFQYVSTKLVDAQSDNSSLVISSDPSSTAINYLSNALTFSQTVKSALPTIYRLLQSETTSDVVEVLQLLSTMYQLGLADLSDVIDHILPLIWFSEASLKNSVAKTLITLLTSGSSQSKSDKFIIILLKILSNASIATFSAIEEFIHHSSLNNLFPKSYVDSLWTMFSDPNTKIPNRTFSIYLLGFFARSDPSIIGDNLERLATFGLDSSVEISLAIASCSTLVTFTKAIKKVSDVNSFRLENTHTIFKRLFSLLTKNFSSNKTNLWFPLFELSIRVVLSLCNCPFYVLMNILTELVSSSFNQTESEMSVQVIGRLIHAISHTASSVMVFLEGDFLTELKSRANKLRSVPIKNSKKSTLNKSLLHSFGANERQEDEINMFGTVADDVETEFAKDLCENELLSNNLFSCFIPLLIHILGSSNTYPSKLVTAASLALSKLMLIRSNAVVVVGDIIQRFPNLIEPWMPHVFSMLSDKETSVRRTVVSILSSLILNDMVKVKGHISELALCVEDSDAIILARTRLFFKELSKKDNAIYNILPDVLSRLSDSRQKLDRSLFERVMHFLLKFLHKERQCESLVDKLCHRFSLTNTPSEINAIGFCLSQLNIGERSYKKLVDNFATYKDKLHDDALYDTFVAIIAKFKKTNGGKTLTEEFEARLSEAHNRGLTPLQSPAKNVQQPLNENENSPSKELETPIILQTTPSKNLPLLNSYPRKRTRNVKKILSLNDSDSDTIPTKI